MNQRVSARSVAGFTIVELSVVIFVLGILAVVIVTGFGSWRNQVAANEVKSDLKQVVAAMESARNFGNGYPSTIPSSFTASQNVELFYMSGDTSNFCIEGRSKVRPSIIYFANSSIDKTEPRAGDCLNGEIPKNGVIAKQTTVTTLAGGGSGCSDGTGSSAGFGYIYGVAVDSVGTVYLADADCMNIRKVTSSGVVTVFAGSPSGTSGSTNGTGTSARFNFPTYIAIDKDGMLYVSDKGNHRIRKITPAGVVTTLAGSGVAGFANGTGTAAQFYDPAGIAVDSSGNVYVADNRNARIRKITPAGVVTTLAGSGVAGFADGNGTAAQFDSSYGTALAVDSAGAVYVADAGNSRIRKITPTGTVTTIAGSGVWGYANGTGTAAQFAGPQGIAVDVTGGIYVGDSGNNRIRHITPSGVVTSLAGNGTSGYVDGAAVNAQFRWVSGIDVDSAGGLIVADYNNRRIRVVR